MEAGAVAEQASIHNLWPATQVSYPHQTVRRDSASFHCFHPTLPSCLFDLLPHIPLVALPAAKGVQLQ